MAGGSNSKKPINRGSDSTNTREGNQLAQVQEHATVKDQQFYDGIPYFDFSLPKSKSTLTVIPKVSEVSSCLGRAVSNGCEKKRVSEVSSCLGGAVTNGFEKKRVSEVSLCLGRAVTNGFEKKRIHVLDTLGWSMTNLNTSEGDKISILAFEVANTIVKGFNLQESLSSESIRHLKEEVLLSEAVQELVSEDMDELLKIVAADKRQELRVVSSEVARFGNLSKDPQWHNLDRYFEKISRELNAQRLSTDEAESIMQQLMTLVQFTVELYHELNALDKFEQDFQRKSEEDQKADSLAILKAEIKCQRKHIRHLKKKSLWSKSLDEVVLKLVHLVLFLQLEISNTFGLGSAAADSHIPLTENLSNCQRLGPAGLALHYANTVLQIDALVAGSTTTANTKDALYQSLPPKIKLALRSKIPSLRVVEELTVAVIKYWMEKLLHILVPMATNTSKCEVKKKSGIMRIETFHHADKDKVEYYILELLLWFHRLAIRSKADGDAG